MEKSQQQIEGENLLALAEQIRLDTPGAKLSEVYDWAVANGISFSAPLPEHFHYNINGNGSHVS